MTYRHACLLALSLAILFACGKNSSGVPEKEEEEEITEQAGKIKGMGDTGGIPEGEIFKLPSWLKIEGQIEGCDDSEPGNECQYGGTGGEWVSVKLKLKSTYPRDTTFTLPEGATFVAGTYDEGIIILAVGDQDQHGALVERFAVEVPGTNSGGGSCSIKVLLYCLNKDKKGSDSNTTYVLGPVIKSPLMRELITLLKDKKTKFSDFDDTEPNGFHYGDVVREVQEIIYHITNGDGLTQDDRDYIASIPNKKK